MLPSIPQADPARRFARFLPAIHEAIASCLGSGRYILGPAVERFENDFAEYLGASHCVGVASGTDALLLALQAVGIGPGDEVITVALTAAGTAQAILLCGAQPCFVDVDPLTRCMDPKAAVAAITTRTAAILPVHLYGQPADMSALVEIAKRYGLALIEDCAQAHGAHIAGRKLGTFGQAAAFSLYPTKNLGAPGDAGAVICSDPATATRLRALRSYGWEDGSRISSLTAGNSRLDALHATVLSVLLPHLDEHNQERRHLARAYFSALQDLPFGLPPDDEGAVYHQFALTCEKQEQLRLHLSARGISTAIHYTPPLHLQPAFMGKEQDALPVTESLARTLLSLPIQPEVAWPHLDYIIKSITTWG
ncbi:MAG: DegT/DnrJ/EryC1/StrS family aminotransferase [Desulfobulbus sp.]|nr:DegT/DnrJ/EryC1/StrS family aminotransferase [Desulfobulbus sp.]